MSRNAMTMIAFQVESVEDAPDCPLKWKGRTALLVKGNGKEAYCSSLDPGQWVYPHPGTWVSAALVEKKQVFEIIQFANDRSKLAYV